ncbi:MAG: hypothetical protein HOI47_33995 [Candidatus Scalindua sp.]|nr:hypothetical protein [Candidatus Scalindua sp.]MBT6231682.1 hypothetical protein [Candidatus Scalindua sp.]
MNETINNISKLEWDKESSIFDVPTLSVKVDHDSIEKCNEFVRNNPDDAVRSHEEIIKEIKTTGKKIFPKKRVLSFAYCNKEK